MSTNNKKQEQKREINLVYDNNDNIISNDIILKQNILKTKINELKSENIDIEFENKILINNIINIHKLLSKMSDLVKKTAKLVDDQNNDIIYINNKYKKDIFNKDIQIAYLTKRLNILNKQLDKK